MSLCSDCLLSAVESGYSVDDLGNLFLNGEKIFPKVAKHSGIPYFYVLHRANGRSLAVPIHRLVAFQKYGTTIFDRKLVVRHLNGNSLDNSVENIAIGTYKDNSMDIPVSVRQRTARSARTLSAEDVNYIREQAANGVPRSALQAEFSVGRSVIGRILRRQTYREI